MLLIWDISNPEEGQSFVCRLKAETASYAPFSSMSRTRRHIMFSIDICAVNEYIYYEIMASIIKTLKLKKEKENSSSFQLHVTLG